MAEKKQARLVKRSRNTYYGGTYEMWDIGDGRVIYVDYNPSICETMAFWYDMKRDMVKSWDELGVWYEDATGGKAIRELGYEPVEDGGSDGI